MHSDPRPTAAASDAVEVRRSTRRRRSVSAFQEGGRTVVVVPAGLGEVEEGRLVSGMLARLEDRSRRGSSDAALAARAGRLSQRYLGGRAVPTSVRWTSNQRTRWGSCTVREGSIRISDRLRTMPAYVVDYVLLHELAHLLHADHGRQFWALLAAYPRTERARGYLEAVSHVVGKGGPGSPVVAAPPQDRLPADEAAPGDGPGERATPPERDEPGDVLDDVLFCRG